MRRIIFIILLASFLVGLARNHAGGAVLDDGRTAAAAERDTR